MIRPSIRSIAAVIFSLILAVAAGADFYKVLGGSVRIGLNVNCPMLIHFGRPQYRSLLPNLKSKRLIRSLVGRIIRTRLMETMINL
jgi:hypothetical protein